MSLADQYLEPNGAPKAGAPVSQLLAAHAERDPGRPALTFPDRVITRLELEQASNRRARQLAAHGVKAGDVVIISLENSPAYYEVALGLWKVGATPLHVSHKLTQREFDEIVSLAKPRLVIGEGSPIASEPTDAFDDTPLPVVISKPWKIATSGGSTGRPKLIVDPHGAVWGIDKFVFRREPDATIVNPGPLHHSAFFSQMIGGLWEGAHIVEMGGFEPEKWLALVDKYKATWAYLVPTMMARIARLPKDVRERYDISSIKTLFHMASICPPWVKRAWIEWLGPDVVWEVYGGTERFGSTSIGGADWLQHPGSVGRPRPGIEVTVFNEAGQTAQAGEVGEIYFRNAAGVHSTFSYIGDKVRERGEWASFGDLGWMDEDGYLFLADRRTDLINCDGVNIYPAEIEGQIDALEGVIDSVVVGAPHDDYGQAPHAFVQLRPDAPAWSEKSLLAAMQDRLSPDKLPRAVTFVQEPIRNEAGKVRRSIWRERAAAGASIR